MGNIPHFWVRVWCSRLFWIFPILTSPLLNKCAFLPHCRTTLSFFIILASPQVCICWPKLHARVPCTLRPRRYILVTLVHRILLRTCAMVRVAFIKETHTNSCPHAASILWQEAPLLHPLETLFSHEEPAKMLLPRWSSWRNGWLTWHGLIGYPSPHSLCFNCQWPWCS